MTKKSREIMDFVHSLEMHELNGEQEGVVLQTDEKNSYGGTNNTQACTNLYECTNYYGNCRETINYFTCSNYVLSACEEAMNLGVCKNQNSGGGGTGGGTGGTKSLNDLSGILGF